MHYDRNDVIAAFRAQHPDSNNPSEATLTAFDQQLLLRYGTEIRKQAPELGIPLTPFNESKLALFAALSAGTVPATQVRFACVYFDSVRPQQPVVVGMPADLLPAPLAGDPADERPALLAELGVRDEETAPDGAEMVRAGEPEESPRRKGKSRKDG